MTTFVSLSKPTRATQYMAPKWAANVQTRVLRSKWGIELAPGADFRFLLESGKEAGTEVETVGPTQRASANLGVLRPTKYQVLVVLNPELQEVATVQGPQLIEPGEETGLVLWVHAHRSLKLSDIQWLARLYLVE